MSKLNNSKIETILCVVCDIFKEKDKFHHIKDRMGLCKRCHDQAQEIIKVWSNETEKDIERQKKIKFVIDNFLCGRCHGKLIYNKRQYQIDCERCGEAPLFFPIALNQHKDILESLRKKTWNKYQERLEYDRNNPRETGACKHDSDCELQYIGCRNLNKGDKCMEYRGKTRKTNPLDIFDITINKEITDELDEQFSETIKPITTSIFEQCKHIPDCVLRYLGCKFKNQGNKCEGEYSEQIQKNND